MFKISERTPIEIMGPSEMDIIYNKIIKAHISINNVIAFDQYEEDTIKYTFILPVKNQHMYLKTEDGIHYEYSDGIDDKILSRFYAREWIYVAKDTEDFTPHSYSPVIVQTPDDDDVTRVIKRVMSKVEFIVFTEEDRKYCRDMINKIKNSSGNGMSKLDKKLMFLSRFANVSISFEVRNRDTGEIEIERIKL